MVTQQGEGESLRRVLVIGGNRFMGYQLVWRLLAAGDDVTVLNRGSRPDPFGSRVNRIVVDRTTDAFRDALNGHAYDAAIDFACFNAEDAQGAVNCLDGQVGHYVFISSGSVYMVLQGVERPVREPLPEGAYDGEPLGEPTDPEDIPSWRYGMGKREAEDVFLAAWQERHFPVTRLRLPIVNGERDPERRLESYIYRILDGGPVLLPDGGSHTVRHVYAAAVVRALTAILGRADTLGEAYNLSQDERPTLVEFIRLLSEVLGAPARPVAVSDDTLRAAGLSARSISPFSGRWSSCLDAHRARAVWGFQHEPLDEYLGRIVAAFFACPSHEPPEDYATRHTERQVAARLGL